MILIEHVGEVLSYGEKKENFAYIRQQLELLVIEVFIKNGVETKTLGN